MATAAHGVVMAGKYRLIKKVGAGAFGQIWAASNIENNEIVAVKLESVDARPSQLLAESKIYRILMGGVGIPYMHEY